MGACSTMDITREDALNEIMRHLDGASGEKIAGVLYELVGYDRCFNFCILSEYKEDPEWGIQYRQGVLDSYRDYALEMLQESEDDPRNAR